MCTTLPDMWRRRSSVIPYVALSVALSMREATLRDAT